MRQAKLYKALATWLLACLVILAGACGGDDDDAGALSKEDERALALFDESGLITANILVKAYKDGRLGTQQELEADMEPFFNKPADEPIPKPFDSEGNFLAFGKMSDEQARAFNIWNETSDKVNGVIGVEKNEAIQAYLDAEKDKDD